MKNNLQGINSRVDEAKKLIGNLEYKEAKTTQSERKKEKRIKKNEDSLGQLQSYQHSHHGVGDRRRR